MEKEKSMNQTEIYIPKGDHFTASTYVFIASPRQPAAYGIRVKNRQGERSCKPHADPSQYNRERISIRWADRSQKYCVRGLPLYSVLFGFIRQFPTANLDDLITYLTTQHHFLQVH